MSACEASDAMLSAALLKRLERSLQGLRHGAVHLIVHDAQVVRVERIERVRLTVSPEAAPADDDGRPTDPSEVRHDTMQE